MSKHAKSQKVVESLKVLDNVSTPGVTGIVLAKGPVMDAEDSAYAGVVLLTTVEGNDFHPFRTARFYFDDDYLGWRQSGSGQTFASLTYAIENFKAMTGEGA
jgi:hypothetical protein